VIDWNVKAIKFYEGIGGRKWCLAIKTMKF
jgi:hypothetical protein